MQPSDTNQKRISHRLTASASKNPGRFIRDIRAMRGSYRHSPGECAGVPPSRDCKNATSSESRSESMLPANAGML
ncbi:hypothetical protein Pla175_12660 [Pirellulimonas nuda]|uniref:Uncharacterized protein n=1 Tax=Pirellulimonas nuda TaxID=2528009 RepID=A0A518D8U1_9BACT|nr:hypothetical protein Pla175_12660 [Pirellulimonas nuda]